MRLLMMMQLCVLTVSFLRAAEWNKIEHKGDELEETESYCSYGYGNETGRVILYDNDSQIKVIAGKYSFFAHEDIRGNDCAVGIVGFYENGKLVKKGKFIVDIEDDKPEQGYLLKRHNLGEPICFDILEIHNHLCQPGNSVRFKLSRYGENQDFDVTVPYNPDFERFDYIPRNVEKRRLEIEKMKLEAQVQAKKEELEKAQKEIERIALQRKIQYAQMTNQLEALTRQYKVSVKNNYTLSAKKQKTEIGKLKNKIDEFVKTNKKDFPTAFE